MTILLVNDEPVDIGATAKITAIVHPGELDIAAPDYFEISPEVTVAFARGVDQKVWDLTRSDPQFLKLWDTVWKEIKPPETLTKGSMALAHVVGLIMLLLICRVEGKKPFLKLPETYLHPVQCSRLMRLILAIYPGLTTS